MMGNLRLFIDRENSMRRLRNEKLALVPTSLEDSAWIVESLECSLSPENLHEDGEISAQEVEEKYNFYMNVKSELEALISADIILEY